MYMSIAVKQAIIDGIEKSLIRKDRWKLYLEGLQTTLTLALLACIVGIVLGLIVAIIKTYSVGSHNPIIKGLSAFAHFYTTVIRGTPIVVQLLILFVLLPSGMLACVVAFGINSGAYVSEIIRAGINSIDIGQMEAGRSLGLSHGTTMRHIILPQAFKNIVPSLFNELIALVKETSVAGYIGVSDLTKVSDGIRGRILNTAPLFIAALVYLTLVFILTWVQRLVERRLAKSDRG